MTHVPSVLLVVFPWVGQPVVVTVGGGSYYLGSATKTTKSGLDETPSSEDILGGLFHIATP